MKQNLAKTYARAYQRLLKTRLVSLPNNSCAILIIVPKIGEIPLVRVLLWPASDGNDNARDNDLDIIVNNVTIVYKIEIKSWIIQERRRLWIMKCRIKRV